MSYEDKSRIRDFDQHAAKIRNGLQELKDADAPRAIWELFQNAVDLSPNCHIRITRTEKGLLFAHNGKSFDEDSLACLIKQVSNKEVGTSEEQVGQYGTGFITTHLYSKVIELNGYVEVQDGFIPLNNFVIDRKEEEGKSLRDKISEQDNLAAKLTADSDGKVERLSDDTWTSFHYIGEQQRHFENIDTALNYLEFILPLVFVFNDRLTSVELILHKDKTIKFSKSEEVIENDGYKIIKIKKHQNELSFVCLFSQDQANTIRVILPYDEDFKSNKAFVSYPKFFLFYPLIGTENYGINSIIHSGKFSPKEKRDALYLSYDNEEIKANVEVNQRELINSLELILGFLKKNAQQIVDPFFIAKTSVRDEEIGAINKPDFWNDQKKGFINQLVYIELVDTLEDRKTIAHAFFFSEDLFHNPEYLQSIYNIASQFWKNIPNFKEIEDWSKLVQSWNNNKINFKGVKEIFQEIQALESIDKTVHPEDLILFYKYVNEYSKIEYFEEFAVLPNIYGQFHRFSFLKEPENIDPVLIQITEVLFEEVPKSFIDSKFILGRTFAKYDREAFKKDINQNAGLLSEKLATESALFHEENAVQYINTHHDASPENELVSFEQIKAFIRFIHINTTTVINQSFSIYLQNFYQLELTSPMVENHVKDFDYRASLKAIFRYLILDITKKGVEWLNKNIDQLSKVLAIVYQNDDFKKTLLHEIKAYPNQYYQLCAQNELKIDAHIPKKLKEFYKELKNIDLKNHLILKEFSDYLNHQDSITPEYLGQEMEKIFNNDIIKYTPITSHEQKELILSIVELITEEESKWKDWFPILNAVKLEVLVGKIIDPKLRTSMFSILTQDNQTIELLGKIAGRADLAEVIRAGQEKIEEEKQKKSDFRHKYIIGTMIEKLIQESLTKSLGYRVQKPKEEDELTIDNKQDGQDIIIFLKEVPVYFVEVKSRWNENSSFRISKKQTIRAFKQSDNYALISVDMAKYSGEDKYEIKEISKLFDITKINMDIGNKINSEMVSLYENSDRLDVFHIDGDFRTYVPLSYIQQGLTIKEFEDELINKLQTAHA